MEVVGVEDGADVDEPGVEEAGLDEVGGVEAGGVEAGGGDVEAPPPEDGAAEAAGRAGPTSACFPESGAVDSPQAAAGLVRDPP